MEEMTNQLQSMFANLSPGKKKTKKMKVKDALKILSEEEAKKLIEDAKLLEKAGCFSIVLEKIPADLAAKVTAAVNIPTIGIGAGSDVDGQVLVVHDLIGLTHEFNPRFLRRYLNLYDSMTKAVKDYIEDVRTQDFPNADERYS